MPINVPEQIEYWRRGSDEDMEAAAILLGQNKLRHAMFFAHLALEKILKAHVVQATNDLPPRTHDLLRLAQRAGIGLSTEQQAFLARFQQHCLEGRYPDLPLPTLSAGDAQSEFTQAQGELEWLRKQLK